MARPLRRPMVRPLLPPMARPRHIVLVGPMGAGKTTVGRLLAVRLARPFRDSDATLALVDERTAAELAGAEGTAALHTREAAILLAQLAADDPSVIAAAASVVENPAAVAALADPAIHVAWLRGSPEVLAERAIRGAYRPWHGREPADYLRDRAEVRDPVYRRLAHVVVDTDSTPPDAAVAAIAAAVTAQAEAGA